MIDDIRAKVSRGEFEFSQHATDQAILRRIPVSELREAIMSGSVIEDYPDDKYGPSCLILGFTGKKRPLHVQCTHPTRELIKIITVYEPDVENWVEYRMRRK